jgi:hypothetical protein
MKSMQPARFDRQTFAAFENASSFAAEADRQRAALDCEGFLKSVVAMKRAAFAVSGKFTPEDQRPFLAMQRGIQDFEPIAGHRIFQAPRCGGQVVFHGGILCHCMVTF